MKRQLQTVVCGAVLLASLASLSACAPLIVGGAVMTGVRIELAQGLAR